MGAVYGTFLVGSVRAETSIFGSTYYGVKYPGFGLPPIVGTVVEYGAMACTAAFFLIVIARAVRTRKMPPLMWLLPGITQYIWFVPGGIRPGFSEFVPAFHSLQYMVIAWAMQLKERTDATGAVPTPGFLTTESGRWFAINVAGGAAMFALLPWIGERAGIEAGLASGVLISAVQIHHFFVDGVIWKLRSQSVVSPLLVNIPELVRRPEPAPVGVAA